MVLATNLGFPRIGARRDLKKAVESYWKGESSAADLQTTAKELRLRHWQLQKDAGLDHIPSNDFSFYDHVLDLTAALGAVPARYEWKGGSVDLDTYFAMARGRQQKGVDVTAMEMTKWFDTNYHYIVPEFEEGMDFKLSSTKIIDEFLEAKSAGIKTRPVIVGPVTYIFLGKGKYDGFDRKETLQKILPVYREILAKLKEAGAEWVQIDEPVLALDLCDDVREGLKIAYETLGGTGLKILLATYFEGLRDNADLAFSLKVDGVHIDLCRGSGQANTGINRAQAQLEEALSRAKGKILSLGVVDGRNIWRANLSSALTLVEAAVARLGEENVFVAGSCSLLHTPVDLDLEKNLDPEIKNWMAFATQKLAEIVTLAKGARDGRGAITAQLRASDEAVKQRKTSPRVNNAAVKARVDSITAQMAARKSPFAARRKLQQKALNLPLFPTTSIGSFPQTPDIRKARAAFRKGDLAAAAYNDAMKKEIRAVVDYQHKVGIDVLVHGEAERNDMVEYFGEQLDGFTFTGNGWVQSYGSRCVKPPVIFGDISRPNPMTVEWSAYAQSLTDKPMKGMLTGPVTILQWSFVRDDQPRETSCKQIALAIRDEVVDLEKAGIRVIQIDEPAIREGLPLRRGDWAAYLAWAVESFKLSASGVADETQIHTHMCYSEFNDIIDSVGALDADVISIETSRSQMELLDAFSDYKYPNEIGPGVYDIHSPRIPATAEMVTLLEKAAKVLDASQIWVNPDCGLKTRQWKEVEPALKNMVDAAKALREKSKSAAA
jgi:5-methyltetrahydropteroyltriglutamate--homocysteine methyltransferase